MSYFSVRIAKYIHIIQPLIRRDNSNKGIATNIDRKNPAERLIKKAEYILKAAGDRINISIFAYSRKNRHQNQWTIFHKTV